MKKNLFVLLIACFCAVNAMAQKAEDENHRKVLRFDFGGGEVAEGYVGVSASDIYSEELGYGFEKGSSLSETVRMPKRKRKSLDALRYDFVGSADGGAFRFSVRLSEGNYKVKVTLGDKNGTSKTTVRAENRRLMLENVTTEKGVTLTDSFNVNIRTPKLSAGNAIKLDTREWNPATGEIKTFTWDDKLTIQFNGENPCVCAIEIVPLDDAVTVFVIGDSTVTDQMGGGTWAQNLPRWLKGNVVVANHAESGQTLKGFRFQRRWDKVMESVKPGDYLFIQLGTNDQKSRGHDPMWPADDKAGDWIRTHSDAETDYIWELAIMVVEARRHGVVPVIVSPLSKFDRKTLKPTSVMDAYGKNAGKAAELTECAFIDLWSMSKDIINAVGEDGLKVYSDGTHTADYGGYLFSLCIAKGIKENKLELAKYLSDDLINIDTKNPTPRFSDFKVPVEKRR